MDEIWGRTKREPGFKGSALRLLDGIEATGILVGLLLFSLSLTPSMLPRPFWLQGLLSGGIFAVGYAIGVTLQWVWDFFELPHARGRGMRRIKLVAIGAGLLIALVFLLRAPAWQNAVRAVMELGPVEAHLPLLIVAVAVWPAALLVGIGTLLVHGVHRVAVWLRDHLPDRVALGLGVLLVGVLVPVIVNGVLARAAFVAFDRFYETLDRLSGDFESPPENGNFSGSADSLVDWDTLGPDSRLYVRSGPSAEEIEALTGRPAEMPVRVAVGLRSAGDPQARAELAFEEMLRVDAFSKSVVLLAMPAGKGWVDPAAIDTLEMLHGGDVASVNVQYTYLTSWLALLVEPEIGGETADALFSLVYDHWRDMSEDDRPALYLHGLSLGALASQGSAGIYDVIAEPFTGALWSGPPFASPTWRAVTAQRDDESPIWRPQIGDGTVLRFENQTEGPDRDRDWGPIRLLYLQYGSDPITFFEPEILFRPPVWMTGERAPDVPEEFVWYPLVTFFQLLLDMSLAQTSAPIGYGHIFAPQHYFDAWVTLTDPPGWSDEDLIDLRGRLSRSGDDLDQVKGGWYEPSL